MKKTIFFLILLLIFVSSAIAETIHLKDGSTIKGKVVSSNEQNVTVDTEMGQLTISKDKIVSVDPDGKEGDKEKTVQDDAGKADSFPSRLKGVEAIVTKAEVLKSQKDLQWKEGVQTAYQTLRKLYHENQGSPQLWFLFAKCYFLNERPKNALDSTKKAIYFDPYYVDAHVLQGDIFMEMSKREATKAEDMYTQAKQVYEKAMALPNISKENESLIYYKLGNVYEHSLYGGKKKAAEFWQKAIETAPESSAAKMAQERISESSK